MIIAVPSKGLAFRTSTDRFLGESCIFYVPKNEEREYRKAIKNVIGVSEKIKGITATRNWILKNAKDRYVVFVDDDLQTQGWLEFHEEHVDRKKMTVAEWVKIFCRAFSVCESLDYKVFGVKTESASRSTYPYYPFRFRAYVTASCMGIINDGTYYFDESFKVKEDYELCLRHVKDRGGILSVQNCYWQNSHWDKEGGCKDYRTAGMEAETIMRLIRMYPGMIRHVSSKANHYTVHLY